MRASPDGLVILIYAPQDADIWKRSRPPMGLLYLGAVLRENGIPTRLFNFQREDASWKDVENAVRGAEKCLVGFACDSDNIHRSVHLSDRLLEQHANVTVVLGGPHVTHVWEPYVTERRAVVRGEGEYALSLLAKQVLEGPGALDDVPGLAYCLDGQIHTNPIALGPYEDVDAIPFPDYSLLGDLDSYVPSVITARGCCFHCHFCSEGSKSRRWRPRSVENVEQELLALKDHFGGEIPYLFIADDTFTVSPKRVHAMCDMLDRLFPDKSSFAFFCEGRANVLAKHPELIHRLKAAGAARVQIGIETGDQSTLDRLNKRNRAENVETVVAAFAEADVPSVPGVFMCGLPDQTEEQVERDIEFAKHLVDLAPGRLELSMVPLSPVPGTEFRDHAQEWGLSILDEDLVTDRLHKGVFAATASLSAEQIESLCQRFNSEVMGYSLEKASCLSPRKIKELIVQAAKLDARTLIVNVLSHFEHVNRVLQSRRRCDYRFLFELPDGIDAAKCFPQRVKENSEISTPGGLVVNDRSPMCFELDEDESRCYRYLSGKLSFEQIAERLAKEEGIALEKALERCLAVYRKCEDHLAAMVIVV